MNNIQLFGGLDNNRDVQSRFNDEFRIAQAKTDAAEKNTCIIIMLDSKTPNVAALVYPDGTIEYHEEIGSALEKHYLYFQIFNE